MQITCFYLAKLFIDEQKSSRNLKLTQQVFQIFRIIAILNIGNVGQDSSLKSQRIFDFVGNE